MEQIQISILKFFQSIQNPFLDIFFEAVTFLGEAGIIIIFLAWLIWNEKKSLTFAFIFTSLFSMTANLVLKIFVHSPRPWKIIENLSSKRVHTATGYSFPSGHTQNASTFYIMLFHLTKNIILKVVLILLVFLIAISRLYLCVHWPIDVIFALVFGFLLAFYLFPYLLKIGENVKIRKTILLIFSISLFIISISIILFPIITNQELDNGGLHKFGILGASVLFSLFLHDIHLNYDTNIKLKKKLLRFFIGLVVIALIYFIPKLTFSYFKIDKNPLIEMFRYALLGFTSAYLYPLVGKKVKLF